MKGIVIYKGKYGATEQYARWLAYELNWPVFRAGEESPNDLATAEVIIGGTSIYIGRLQLKQWLLHHRNVLKEKKLILFLVAGTPPEQKEKLDACMHSNLPAGMLDHCDVYYLPGRLVKKKLSWLDRFLLKMGARLAKDPADRKHMLTDYDHVERRRVMPIAAAVKRLADENAVLNNSPA